MLKRGNVGVVSDIVTVIIHKPYKPKMQMAQKSNTVTIAISIVLQI